MADMSDSKAVDKLIETVKEQRGRIDLLIYNAGIMSPSISWEAKEQELQDVMNVNFFSPIKITKGLLGRLNNGHLAVVASAASLANGGTLQDMQAWN